MERLQTSKLTIHRGASEIGGNCVEIASPSARILLDFGLPLDAMDIKHQDLDKYRLPIDGVYKNDRPSVNAVFISHAHPDHYGLLCEIHPQIPVYLSETTYNIIHEILPLIPQAKEYKNNFKIIKTDETVKIGDIGIKAYPVEHSAAEAFGFEISIGGKKIFYSGDLRTNGTHGYLTSDTAKKLKNIDYLLLEGTSVTRENTKTLKEKDIPQLLVESFEMDKLDIICFSSQNLDRLVSVYKAALKSRRTLVLDPYTCYVLEKVSHLSPRLPKYSSNNIAVYFAPNSITRALVENKAALKYTSHKISLADILKNPGKYIVKDNYAITNKILKETKQKPQLIYSLWKGYLEDKNNFWHKYKDEVIHIHTSGHADTTALQKFAAKVNPAHIIPIHTQNSGKYKELFNTDIIMLKNGQKMAI